MIVRAFILLLIVMALLGVFGTWRGKRNLRGRK